MSENYIPNVYESKKHAMSDLRFTVSINLKVSRGEKVNEKELNNYDDAVKRIGKLSGNQIIDCVSAISSSGLPFPKR